MRFIIILAVLLTGCIDSTEKPYTEYSIGNSIGISSPADVERCVTNIVKAASERMTTSDYEDVDETIEEASDYCATLYTVSTRTLYIRTCERGICVGSISKKISELSKEEKEIYDELFTGKKSSLKIYYSTY